MVVHCAVTQVILCSVSTTERERNLKPGNFPSVYPPVLVTKSTKWKHWPSTGFLGQSARHQTNSMKSDIKLMHRDHQELSKIPVLERIIEGIGGISPDTTAWFKGVAPGCTKCEVALNLGFNTDEWYVSLGSDAPLNGHRASEIFCTLF